MDDSINRSVVGTAIVFCLALVISADSLFGCASVPTSASGRVTIPKGYTPQAPGIIESWPEANVAWRNFIANTHFRLATAGDFQLAQDRQNFYGDGDFDRDGTYADFAVIVVDTKRRDAKRFSLVIFNKRQKSKGYNGPFWVYRGFDLSRTSLSLISHGPLLVVQEPDASESKVCVVAWNPRTRNYSCRRDVVVQPNPRQ